MTRIGDIFDESDLPSAEFHEMPNGDLIVRTRVDLRKLCARLDVAWDPEIAASAAVGC